MLPGSLLVLWSVCFGLMLCLLGLPLLVLWVPSSLLLSLSSVSCVIFEALLTCLGLKYYLFTGLWALVSTVVLGPYFYRFRFRF